jgi:hypothetical protein
MTAEAITPPLVTLEEIRRRLGYPRVADVPAMLDQQAEQLGMRLEHLEDWAGRPALTAGQAGELVGRIEARDQAANQVEQRRKRQGEVVALEAQQRSEQRAALAYDLALRTFADEGVALHLAHRAYSQSVSDEALTGSFGAAGERWRQGYRTLAPEPVAATSELQEQAIAENDARITNRTGQVSARSLRRATEAMQGKRRVRP